MISPYDPDAVSGAHYVAKPDRANLAVADEQGLLQFSVKTRTDSLRRTTTVYDREGRVLLASTAPPLGLFGAVRVADADGVQIGTLKVHGDVGMALRLRTGVWVLKSVPFASHYAASVHARPVMTIDPSMGWVGPKRYDVEIVTDVDHGPGLLLLGVLHDGLYG